jgi:hypothetical protein
MNSVSGEIRRYQVLTVIMAVLAVGLFALAIRIWIADGDLQNLQHVVVQGPGVSCYTQPVSAADRADFARMHVLPIGGKETICVQAPAPALHK